MRISTTPGSDPPQWIPPTDQQTSKSIWCWGALIRSTMLRWNSARKSHSGGISAQPGFMELIVLFVFLLFRQQWYDDRLRFGNKISPHMKGSKALHRQGWVHNQYLTLSFWHGHSLLTDTTVLCLIFPVLRPDPLPHHHGARQGLDAGHVLQERAEGSHAQCPGSQPLRETVRWRDGPLQHPRVSDSVLSHEPQDVSPWYTEMSHADSQLWLGHRWLGLYLEGEKSCPGRTLNLKSQISMSILIIRSGTESPFLASS